MSLFGRIADMFGEETPTPVDDDPATREDLRALTERLSLYHYFSCPFCARVHRALAKLGVQLELRDISQDAGHRRDLAAGGGRTTVPCLRIERPDGDGATWMYESRDIIAWLEREIGQIRARHADAAG